MRSGQLSLFAPEDIPQAYTPCEYFLLISPPSALIEKIRAMKKKLHKIVPVGEDNLHSIAHISLLKLRMRENDELVTGKVRRALTNLHGFTISLNGAEVFAHGRASRSLVLRISNPEPVNILHAWISSEFGNRKGITPHLTIAKKIPAKNFAKVPVQDFNRYDSFLCNSVTILKKTGEQEHYTLLAKIPLAAAESSVLQGGKKIL
ncbi:2'-5' RNA ligase family protein [Chitinophaga sp. XS-30]|uniref:2'-5' RNA ligase family protein n=1 Tax=Chitinophaga sp. XS-30 TaxID=2604421 RepID=UPI0011DCE8D1|nr:2'-5' RNA ligase family protein [Chitinophaga sp. XS-30]QEH39675.1 hypothetical protein FW415_01855 [Chitinophaga sp. XS-30]